MPQNHPLDFLKSLNKKALAIVLALIVTPFTFAGPATAANTEFCAHCHGTDGNSSSGAYPSLAGQTKQYLYKQLKDFKEGRRTNSMMTPSVGVLSDQDMQELADYFSSQVLLRDRFKPDPVLVAQGKKNADQAQCAACHQPGLKGLNEFPRLTRQKHSYTIKQIRDYRDGARTNDNGVMGPAVKNLTDGQIEALAHYLSSL